MKDFLIYYSLVLTFYIIEIIFFSIAYESWEHDVFWLNMGIRSVLVFIFSILVKNIIFQKTEYFYIKFSVLVVLNPLLSSLILKLFTVIYPLIAIIVLKFLADLICSFIVFFAMKKLS